MICSSWQNKSASLGAADSVKAATKKSRKIHSVASTGHATQKLPRTQVWQWGDYQFLNSCRNRTHVHHECDEISLLRELHKEWSEWLVDDV